MPAAAHTPERTCRICRFKKPKSELTRWVNEGGWIKDVSKTMSGRGVYTCSEKCTDILVNKFIGKK
jgi:predicted RNA-binding protein YlxR (DUF448 family)